MEFEISFVGFFLFSNMFRWMFPLHAYSLKRLFCLYMNWLLEYYYLFANSHMEYFHAHSNTLPSQFTHIQLILIPIFRIVLGEPMSAGNKTGQNNKDSHSYFFLQTHVLFQCCCCCVCRIFPHSRSNSLWYFQYNDCECHRASFKLNIFASRCLYECERTFFLFVSHSHFAFRSIFSVVSLLSLFIIGAPDKH